LIIKNLKKIDQLKKIKNIKTKKNFIPIYQKL